jgi:DNA-directed RNA polymerase specialized sigma24 family protein
MANPLDTAYAAYKAAESTPQALDTLLRAVGAYARQQAERREDLARTGDSDDVSAKVMVKVWEALPKFGGRSSFRTWVERIVRNVIYDRYRYTKRRDDVCIDLVPEPEAPGHDDFNVPKELRGDPIVALILEGATPRDIQLELGMTKRNYYLHLGQIKAKLGTLQASLTSK